MSGQTPELEATAPVLPSDDVRRDADGTPRAPRPRRRGSKHRPAWEEPPTRVGLTLKGVVLALVVLAVLFPLWTVLLTSFSTQAVPYSSYACRIASVSLDVRNR